MWQRRLLSTNIHKASFEASAPLQNRNLKNRKWAVKQVKKSNFVEALDEIKTHIANSDFVAVSLQKTGAFSSPWQKVLPFDTADIAYFKAKYAAERFQMFQFAVCPFSVKSSKLIAYPYNFHLFPRDELKIGMPSYSFLCQSSYLTAMAREGFDFNACINDGISYLSRAQESAAKDRTGNPLLKYKEIHSPLPKSANSVADSMFVERIKSRIRNWISACQDSEKKTDANADALINSLRKIVSGSEMFGLRSSLTVDVCSDRQVQLVLESLNNFTSVVPLLVPGKEGNTQAVRVVLTTSEEDKVAFEKELQLKEEEHNKRIRGFREVIDLISTSQKPVVAHNLINEFTFLHSKFLAPLPSTINEFRTSLCSIFPYIFDVNHLMMAIGSQRKLNKLSAAISQMKRRFTGQLNVEIPETFGPSDIGGHGRSVLRICELFAKLSLTLSPDAADTAPPTLMSEANIFNPHLSSPSDLLDEDVGISTKDTRRINISDLVFLWGFGEGMSARKLKNLLSSAHEAFSGEFDVRMADTNCAVVVFWNPGFAERFLEIMNSGGMNHEPLKDLISEGVRAASYRTYQRVCEQGLWEADLADALDKALEGTVDHVEANSEQEPLHVSWNSDELINLDDL
ncbi:OLC1v1031094C1 [Oldenlandia corymbosa var. corymbosa]|uniref:OLC1v1031094C1 n=1 Tax=Oldenlandia corymbosa var. corymbosa TaxID=529605 RepID=A0AAV1CL39_OLDCO|nr:OLC1v1031094C1 [Oldenlandia corymbosa var. corymbosa]